MKDLAFIRLMAYLPSFAAGGLVSRAFRIAWRAIRRRCPNCWNGGLFSMLAELCFVIVLVGFLGFLLLCHPLEPPQPPVGSAV